MTLSPQLSGGVHSQGWSALVDRRCGDGPVRSVPSSVCSGSGAGWWPHSAGSGRARAGALLTADGFMRGEENSVIAKRLRGSVRSGDGGASPGVRESERHCARRALAKRPKVEESDRARAAPAGTPQGFARTAGRCRHGGSRRSASFIGPDQGDTYQARRCARRRVHGSPRSRR
jgi:hypothetical protein